MGISRRERRFPRLRSGVPHRHILDAQAATALGECWTQMFSAAMHCGGSTPYQGRGGMEGNGIDDPCSCRLGEIWSRPASIERVLSANSPPICSQIAKKKKKGCLPSSEALASTAPTGRYFAFSFSASPVDPAQVVQISSPQQQFSVYPERTARNRPRSSHEASA